MNGGPAARSNSFSASFFDARDVVHLHSSFFFLSVVSRSCVFFFETTRKGEEIQREKTTNTQTRRLHNRLWESFFSEVNCLLFQGRLARVRLPLTRNRDPPQSSNQTLASARRKKICPRVRERESLRRMTRAAYNPRLSFLSFTLTLSPRLSAAFFLSLPATTRTTLD